MRKLISAIAFLAVAFTNSALAGDAVLGAKVFSANCAACHAGGSNLVMATKNLKQETLQKYGMDSIEAIVNQITKGKNAMPSFKGRLKPNQIENVAAYILEQSAKGWPRNN